MREDEKFDAGAARVARNGFDAMQASIEIAPEMGGGSGDTHLPKSRKPRSRRGSERNKAR